ncbi:flagellar biosynthesis protein FlhF [Virgibacillus ainsalahensis]
MKVKKYVAPTMPEVMNQVRKDLGSEAVILNSKEIRRGGIFGFFKKKNIEVIAGLDPQPATQPKRYVDVREKLPTIDKDISKTTNNEIINEIKHLKKIFEQQSSEHKNRYQSDYMLVYQHLLDQEVNKELAIQISDKVIEDRNYPEKKLNLDEIMNVTAMEIKERLSNLSFNGIMYDKKIVQFVGPTGVGKTTTLAKVAAKSILTDKKKVAFITADTYRIAAIEQLKTYAQILNVPIEVAYTIDDYKAAIEKFESYDLILVDTAGRNFRNETYIKELQKTIDLSLDMASYLVLSLTSKPKDLMEIFDQFYHIPIKEVIFTKIDETRQYGSLLNIALEKEIGIAYLTNGQDVPDDLIPGTPGIVADYIAGDYYGT